MNCIMHGYPGVFTIPTPTVLMLITGCGENIKNICDNIIIITNIVWNKSYISIVYSLVNTTNESEEGFTIDGSLDKQRTIIE